MNTRWAVSGRVLTLVSAGLLCGCATLRHPTCYKTGRPEWTFDVLQAGENDLPADFEKAKYRFFLGAETVASATEEGARLGALLNAQQQVKIFLHSHGESVLRAQIRSGVQEDLPLRRFGANSEVVRFQALLDTRADAQVAHMDAVRWYMEEHRPFWRMVQPFPNDTRASHWRAWCIVAVPNDLCDIIIADAVNQYRRDTAGAPPLTVAPPTSPSDAAAGQRKPPEKGYARRVADSAYLGVANIFCGPIELLNQPFTLASRQAHEDELLQFAGFLEGIPVGVVKGALRIVYGTGSLVVAPLGLSMLPVVQPVEPAFSAPLRLL